MTEPRVLRTPPYRKTRRVDAAIGLVIIVAVFAALFVCAVIGANR